MSQTEVAEKIKERRIQYKEQKVRSLKLKASRDNGYTIPDVTKKAFELGLRRVATQGIVRLFNAVKDYQHRNDEKEIAQLASRAGMKKRAQIMADVSKEKFEKAFDRSADKEKRKEQAKAKLGKRGAKEPVRRPMGEKDGGLDEFA